MWVRVVLCVCDGMPVVWGCGCESECGYVWFCVRVMVCLWCGGVGAGAAGSVCVSASVALAASVCVQHAWSRAASVYVAASVCMDASVRAWSCMLACVVLHAC